MRSCSGDSAVKMQGKRAVVAALCGKMRCKRATEPTPRANGQDKRARGDTVVKTRSKRATVKMAANMGRKAKI